MKRIGILGGTFNPIHIGHLAIAQAAYEKMDLDKVIFVPSYLPPHKSSKNILPATERYRMVEMAIKNYENFEISDFEIKREGKSYTIDTVEFFHEKYQGKAKLYFILGEDAAQDLSSWKRIKDIEKLANFVIVNRPGIHPGVSEVKTKHIKMPGLDVSSSYVRKRVFLNKPITYLVPEEVKFYIEKNKFFKK